MTAIAIISLLLVSAVLGWAVETRLRAVFARPAGTAEQDAAAFAELLVDAEPGAFRWCPEEMRTTYHAEHADGSHTCWTCHTTTAGDQ
ncbi:hypothetical protein [Streptomyces malaysiensis]|uniref:hypothetical protein n=1 Tax=Streptomyces malaysiensis TaxID=92644 RepID=UPI0011CE4EE6|nr:hypothetical protein [Streptomyces malaysiensis]